MAKKHAEQVFQIHSDYKQLKELFNKEVENYENSDKEKLANIIQIIKKRDQEHEAIQRDLLNKLNLSRSQLVNLNNVETSKHVEFLRADNAAMHRALDDLLSERDEMYRFSRRLIEEGIVDKESANRIKRDFERNYQETSPTKAKYRDVFAETTPGFSNLTSQLEKPKLQVNLSDRPNYSQDRPMPTVAEYDSPDQIANTYYSLGQHPSPSYPVAQPPAVEMKKGEALLKSLASFESPVAK